MCCEDRQVDSHPSTASRVSTFGLRRAAILGREAAFQPPRAVMARASNVMPPLQPKSLWNSALERALRLHAYDTLDDTAQLHLFQHATGNGPQEPPLAAELNKTSVVNV